MRGRKERRLVVAVLATVVVGLAAAGAGLSDSTYTDPTGDATGGAPDITGLAVSNDPAGVITFKLTMVAAPVSNSLVGIVLDADSNPTTGLGGAEYFIITSPGGVALLLKWNGTAFDIAPAPSLSAAVSGNVVEFRIGRQEFGGVGRFGFGALAFVSNDAGDVLGEDDAPDGGLFVYELTFPQCANGKDDDGDGKVDAVDLGCSSPTDNLESDDPVTITVGKPVANPAKPKAGKAVVVSAGVTRVETGRGIPNGTVKCAGRVGTKALKGVGKVAGGRASCAFKLPVTASGKMLRGTITVTHLGKTKVVPFGFKVS